MAPLKPWTAMFPLLLLLAAAARAQDPSALNAPIDMRGAQFLETFRQFLPAEDFAPARGIDPAALESFNKINAKVRPGAPPLTGASLLGGPHAFTLTVLDDKTLRPVGDCRVHVLIQARLVYGAALLGRLESKKITDGSGRCRWERLGWLEAEFQIRAAGYLPKKEVFKIPQAGAGALVRLTPAGSVTGRLLDASTGEGLAGVAVTLKYAFENRTRHTQYGYTTRSGADGRFRLEVLPPNQYRMELPDLISEMALHQWDVGQRAWAAYRLDPARPDPAAFQKAWARALADIRYIPPRLPPVELKGSAALDVGAIRLERAPTLELQITYEGAVPLANFPFELSYPIGFLDFDTCHFQTDGDGRARVALAGWRPGMDAIVYAPLKMGERYAPKQLMSRRPDPAAPLSDRKWYEMLAGLNNPPSLSTPQLRHNGKVEMSEYFGVKISETDYDSLTQDQKEEFHRLIMSENQAWRTESAQLAALSDHPNYVLFTPQAGQVSRIRLDYKPTPDDLDLVLRFIDKATRAPVPRFKGIVNDMTFFVESALSCTDFNQVFLGSSHRTFESTDATGAALVPALTLSPLMKGFEETMNATTTTLEQLEELAHLALFRLVVEAPGYVRQAFTIPLARARAGGELTFELERAAAVRGRVLLGATGEPPTSATLRALLQRTGRWGRDTEEVWLRGQSLKATLRDTSATLASEERLGISHKEKLSITSLDLPLGADGRFAAEGLRPGDTWSLTIDPGVLPRTVRENIPLSPGMNDLGDIRLELPGWLTGRITDECGEGIEGACFEFPLEWIGRHDRATTRTRAGGRYRLDLLPLKSDRQLVYLVPPWGDDRATTTPPPFKTTIRFETAVDLDRCASQTLDAALDRGHTLLVRIPPSPRLQALARLASDPAGFALTRHFEPEPPEQPYFALRRLALQGLDETTAGLTYAQTAEMTGEGGRLTDGTTLTLRLEHVPAGRHALLAEGGLMDAARPNDPAVEMDPGLFEGIPLAYAEFVMPATTATLTLTPPPALDVVLAMPELKLPPAEGGSDVFPVVFLEREGAWTSLHGNVLRRACLNDRRKEGTLAPEGLRAPLVGYGAFFAKQDGVMRKVRRRVPLRVVLPGCYRLRAYASQRQVERAEPYFETTVELVRGAGWVELPLPSPAPPRP